VCCSYRIPASFIGKMNSDFGVDMQIHVMSTMYILKKLSE
jgi:hypothetical protein